MTFSAFHTFGITHTLALVLNPTRSLPLATTLQLPAASKVVLYEWLLHGLVNFTTPQSPTTAQTAILKTWLFILRIMQISQIKHLFYGLCKFHKFNNKRRFENV